MTSATTVVLLATEPESPGEVGQWLAGHDFTLMGMAETPGELVALVGQWQAQVALVVDAGDGAAAQGLGELAAAHPGVGRVVALRARDFAACRAALRAGADEVLVVPDEAEGLPQALHQARRAGMARLEAAAARAGAAAQAGLAGGPDTTPGLEEEAGGRGYLLAFWSGRGGAGKSTLAAGTALALQHRGAGRVLLVDLDLALGGAEVPLDLRPDRTLLDLLPVIRELDRSHLERVAVTHPSGMQVLCGGAGPARAAAFGEEEARLLLEACRRHFDMVILDVPTALGPVTRVALREATAVMYVVTPDLPAVRALGRALEAVDQEGLTDRQRLALVMNRASRVADVTRREVESLAQLPVVGEVRSDFRTLQAHLGQGRPLIQPGGRRGSALGREIERLAANVGG